MNLYLAKIVFNIDIDNGTHTTQFDEQLRVVEAASADEAFFKARSLGKREEEMFLNLKQKQVNWKFIDVTEIRPLHDLRDGSEIYSSTHETEQANEYINFVRHKAMVIQAENQLFV